MRREDLIFNLGRLGYTLLRTETPVVKEHEVLELLDELADSKDPRLVEGFPVVLANCAQRDLKLNSGPYCPGTNPTATNDKLWKSYCC